jgi:hypothetical protein
MVMTDILVHFIAEAKSRSFDSRLNCLVRQKRAQRFGGLAQDDRVFSFVESCGDSSKNQLRDVCSW